MTILKRAGAAFIRFQVGALIFSAGFIIGCLFTNIIRVLWEAGRLAL